MFECMFEFMFMFMFMFMFCQRANEPELRAPVAFACELARESHSGAQTTRPTRVER